MEKLFARFTDWLGINHPEGLEVLNPPATDDDIQKLEAVLGFSLPEDLAQALKIHNGQNPVSGPLLPGGEFLSTKAIAEQWTIWKGLVDEGTFKDIRSEPERGIKNDWWNIKWIPVTHDGGGNHSCIDTDPDKGGTYGQVISMEHDMDERNLLAKSFTLWLSAYISDLEKGEYVYSDDYDAIVHKDDA